MRWIDKRPAPAGLLDWLALANADWQPTYADLRGAEKRATLDALLTEQGALCGYCERRIGRRPGDRHIEHLRPQELFPDLALDYRNLMASCQGEQPPEPRHCGHAKENWFDEANFVSPADPDCSTAFGFTPDGHIHPAQALTPARATAAATTIKHLNLDCGSLARARSAALDGIIGGLTASGAPDPDDLQRIVDNLALPDAAGRIAPFPTFLLHTFAGL